jgi:hypothetical protein
MFSAHAMFSTTRRGDDCREGYDLRGQDPDDAMKYRLDPFSPLGTLGIVPDLF